MTINIPIILYYTREGLLYTKDYLNKVPFIFKLSNLTYSISLVCPINTADYSFQATFQKGDGTISTPVSLAYVANETVDGETWYRYTGLIDASTLNVSASNRTNTLKISFYYTNRLTSNQYTLNTQPYVATCQYSVVAPSQPLVEYTPLEQLQMSIDLALSARPLKDEVVFHVANLPNIVTEATSSSYNIGYVYTLTQDTTDSFTGASINYYKGDTLLATTSGWVYLGKGIKDINACLLALEKYITTSATTTIPLLPQVNAGNNGKYLVVDNATSRIIAVELPIVDTLSSQLTTSALSANQGRVLKGLIDSNTSSITEINVKSDNAVATANQANTKSDNAVGVSNQANTKSDNAVATSNQANTTANNISGIANQALSVANASNVIANDAKTMADSMQGQIDLKQNKEDNTLQTTVKNVVGAINELNSRQSVSNYSYQDYNTMITQVLASSASAFKIGDNLLLINNGSGSNYQPDRWVSALAETYYSTVTTLANGQIGVGYFILATISGDKPDITNMATTDTTQTITGAKDFTGGLSVNAINVATQGDVETLNNTILADYSKVTQLDFNAIIQGGEIIGSLTSAYTFALVDNNRLFEIDLLLPIATISGSLPNTTPIYLKDSANKVVNIKTPLTSGTTAVFGDLKQVCKYDTTGFRWLFFGSCTYVDGATPTITLSLIPSVNAYNNVVLTLSNEEMLNAITSTDATYGEYNVGTIVTPTDSNGYLQGALYKYVNTGTSASPIYTWNIVSITKTSELTNDSDYQNATQVNALIETYITTNAYAGSSSNL